MSCFILFYPLFYCHLYLHLNPYFEFIYLHFHLHLHLYPILLLFPFHFYFDFYFIQADTFLHSAGVPYFYFIYFFTLSQLGFI